MVPHLSKRVLLIIIDQMKYQYFKTLEEICPNCNLLKLKKRSAFFENAFVRHLPTSTPPGHATISTGTSPSQNGITGYEWLQKKTNKIIGTAEHGDARYLISETFASAAKRNKFKVVVIAGKIEPAILLGGDKADITLFPFPFRLESGEEVFKFVDQRDVHKKLEATKKRVLEKRDLIFTPFWAKNADLQVSDDEKFTPKLDKVTSAAVLLALENELRDIDNWALLVSFSGTDNIGHKYGPGSQEVYDNILSLDGCIGDILRRVEVTNPLIIVVSDHGCTNVSYTVRMEPLYEENNVRFRFVVFDRSGERSLRMWKEIPFQIAKHICFRDLRNFGLIGEGIGYVYVKEDSKPHLHEIAEYFQNSFPELIQKVYIRRSNGVPEEIKAINNERAGDLILIPQDNVRFINIRWSPPKGEHGSLGEDDQHIPLLISGPGIQAGVYKKSVRLQDIVPMIKVLLDIPCNSTERMIGEVLVKLVTSNQSTERHGNK